MDCSLTRELEAALGSLSKAVLSQPLNGEQDSRVDIRPLLIKNRPLFQTSASGAGRPSTGTWRRRSCCASLPQSWTGATGRR